MDPVSLGCFLIVNLGLAALSGYYLGKTKLLDKNGGRLTGWLRSLCGIAIFGIISIIGTLSAVDVNGVIMNNRDSAPVSAGLYFGPVIGVGAAAVAGYYFRDRPSLWLAALIGVAAVLVHSVLVILLSEGEISVGWQIVMETPAAAGYGIVVIISIMLFSWLYRAAQERTE